MTPNVTQSAPDTLARRPRTTSPSATSTTPLDHAATVTAPAAAWTGEIATHPAGSRNRKGDSTPPRDGRPGEVRRIFTLFAEHKIRLLFVAALIIASSL